MKKFELNLFLYKHSVIINDNFHIKILCKNIKKSNYVDCILFENFNTSFCVHRKHFSIISFLFFDPALFIYIST
jgi:hypothetical protein